MQKAQTILSADIGTSSLKAAYISEEGFVYAFCRVRFENQIKNKEALEWKNAFIKALKILSSKAPAIKPNAVCISGNGPSVVCDDGTCVLWNTDISDCPSVETSSLFIPRILYLKNRFTESFEKSKYIFSGPEFLCYLLTGEAKTFLPEKRYTNAYWTDDELNRFGFTDEEKNKFPEFKFSGELLGCITKQASEWLENIVCEGTEVFCGAPDFISDLAGCAIVNPLRLLNRTGSGEGFNLCIKNQLYYTGLRTLPSFINDLWNISFLSKDSGLSLERIKCDFAKNVCEENASFLEEKNLCETKNENFTEKIFNLLLKNFYSEKTKVNQFTVKEKAPLSYKKAAEQIDSLLASLKDGVNLLRTFCKENNLSFPASMTVTGGQAFSREYLKLKALYLNIEIEVPSFTDCELMGNAAFALYGMKKYPSIKQACESLYKAEKIK